MHMTAALHAHRPTLHIASIHIIIGNVTREVLCQVPPLSSVMSLRRHSGRAWLMESTTLMEKHRSRWTVAHRRAFATTD